ncbi:MAG: hypothetical protein SangKO_099410 [Sandaracinaceae bacterium]
MTTPLRLAAVVVALLITGFTAEHLASEGRAATLASVATPTATLNATSSTVPTPSGSSAAEAQVAFDRRLPMGPVQGPVSSPFGPRVHPVSGRVRHHDGVDIAVPAGTAVWTVAPGTVRSVGRQRGYGLVVEIDHPRGLGQPVRTRYAHLASVDATLRAGSVVGLGVAIGASGGRPGLDGVSTGAHLHFEVRDDRGRPIDPARIVRLSGQASPAPRWIAPRSLSRASGEPQLTSPKPRLSHTDEDPKADSLASLVHELPDLVLPDYPSLPTITGTP